MYFWQVFHTIANSDQSYRAYMIINYDSRAVIYYRKTFIRSSTELFDFSNHSFQWPIL